MDVKCLNTNVPIFLALFMFLQDQKNCAHGFNGLYPIMHSQHDTMFKNSRVLSHGAFAGGPGIRKAPANN